MSSIERGQKLTFNYQPVDRQLESEVNNLTPEELNGLYTLENDILNYGIDAIGHIHFLRMARAVERGELEMEELLEMFECKFYENERIKGFGAKNGQLAKDGIFLPVHKTEDNLPLFNSHYGNNRMAAMNGIDVPEAHSELMRRHWKPEDLSNPKLLQQGEKFAHDLWAICALSYERNLRKPSMAGIRGSDKVITIADKLVNYYWGIVLAGNESEIKRKQQWLIYNSDSTPIPGDTTIHMGNGRTLEELINARTLATKKESPDGGYSQTYFSYQIEAIHLGTRQELVNVFADLPGIMVDL